MESMKLPHKSIYRKNRNSGRREIPKNPHWKARIEKNIWYPQHICRITCTLIYWKSDRRNQKRVKWGDITIEWDWNAKLKQQYVEQVARAIMFPDKQLSKLNPSEQAQFNTGKANINYYLITSTSPSYAELIAKIQTTPEEPVAMNYKQDEKLSKRA